LPRSSGHFVGIRNIKSIINASLEMEISNLSLFAFSVENRERPKPEVSALLKLMIYFLNKEISSMHKKGIKVRVVGDKNNLPGELVEAISNAEVTTINNAVLKLNILFNYSGRQDVIHACKELIQISENHYIELNEEKFEQHLYTAGIPDINILIRTGGETRTSNFMIWQLVNSEFIVSDVLWPDFKGENLQKLLMDYKI